jgi:hypothetical protein
VWEHGVLGGTRTWDWDWIDMVKTWARRSQIDDVFHVVR